ncbi:MAG: hypothetical protein BWY57_02688 [Betaproteobacteria bacterium ADurb.Bin341]|nr:MAG: hypothetical protein BWY57_02688 [Betaproteobacteria bacterium ADurb.Bin341]
MSISWLLTNAVAACLLPPLNGLLLALMGFLLLRRRPRLGRWLIGGGIVLLFMLSLQVVAQWLLRPLENRYPPLQLGVLARIQADAVVVLGGGRYRAAPEFGDRDDVTRATLERLRYAALLAKTLNQPLLVSGGRPDGGASSEAEVMQSVLRRDFGIEVRWLEAGSDNTRESARNTARLLGGQGVRRVVLVTHAWHMPRSVAAFERAGFEVVPAPMGYLSFRPRTPLDFIPRADALESSSMALHEWIGMAWYALRG